MRGWNSEGYDMRRERERVRKRNRGGKQEQKEREIKGEITRVVKRKRRRKVR